MENVYNIQIVTNGDMSQSTVTSDVIDLSRTDGYAVYAEWTGSPNGVIELQASLDGNTWVTITGSPSIITTAGNFMWNVGDVFYDKVRVLYIKTSGSGTLNVHINGKADVTGA